MLGRFPFRCERGAMLSASDEVNLAEIIDSPTIGAKVKEVLG